MQRLDRALREATCGSVASARALLAGHAGLFDNPAFARWVQQAGRGEDARSVVDVVQPLLPRPDNALLMAELSKAGLLPPAGGLARVSRAAGRAGPGRRGPGAPARARRPG